MISLSCHGNQATATLTGRLVEGEVGVKVTVTLDEAFDGLAPKLIARCGRECRDMAIINGVSVYPHECLIAGQKAEIGIYATDDMGATVIPTSWAGGWKVDPSTAGVNPDASVVPTPGIVDQINAKAHAAEVAADSAVGKSNTALSKSKEALYKAENAELNAGAAAEAAGAAAGSAEAAAAQATEAAGRAGAAETAAEAADRKAGAAKEQAETAGKDAAEAKREAEEARRKAEEAEGAVPTKTSQLENDSGFLTKHQDLSPYARKDEIPEVPKKVSELENDSNFLTKNQADNDYALKDALANKLTEPSGMAVGNYFRIAAIDEKGHAVLEAVNEPRSVFTAVYGETAEQEIVKAIDDGKTVLCKSEDYLLRYTGENAFYYVFSGVVGANTLLYYARIRKGQGTWNRGSYGMHTVLNPIADYGYPTDKAVADYVNRDLTAEEQLAARKRMGTFGGTAKLIFDMVVDTETDAIDTGVMDHQYEYLFIAFQYAGTASGSIGTLFMQNDRNVAYAFRAFTATNVYAFASCTHDHGIWHGEFTSPTSKYATQQILRSAPDAYFNSTPLKTIDNTPYINRVRIYKNNSGGVQIAAGSIIKIYGV